MFAAVQDAAPDASPELPVEFVHLTDVTLPEAVPLMVMLASEVETMLRDGETIMSAGDPNTGGAGGVGGGGFGGGVTGSDCRVTVIPDDAVWPAVSVAVTVIMLAPGISGTAPID